MLPAITLDAACQWLGIASVCWISPWIWACPISMWHASTALARWKRNSEGCCAAIQGSSRWPANAGLAKAYPPTAFPQCQGGLRRMLQLRSGLRPLARRFYGSLRVRRDFSADHCQLSLQTTLAQLGLEAVDLLLLQNPALPMRWIPPWRLPSRLATPGIDRWLRHVRPAPSHVLALAVTTWPCSPPAAVGRRSATAGANSPFLRHGRPPQLRDRFGRIRRSLAPIHQAFTAVPQHQRH
jgi:hypothetical protein